MAAAVVDPLQTLSAALAAPPDSKEQADLLTTLRESLEARPQPIPILCTTLIKNVSGANDSLLKRWVLDLLHFAICRSPLSLEVRTNLSAQSLEALAMLLHDHNTQTVKTVIGCFGTMYPLLFRSLCSNRNYRQQWDVLSGAKSRILEMVYAQHTPAGVRLAAVKFMQRVILVQTRGVTDPRLQNRSDSNLSLCPPDHPFIPVQALEAEGMKLLEGIITLFAQGLGDLRFMANNVDLLSAILNSMGNLVKLRPAFASWIVLTLSNWTPASLAGLPASSVRSVEKAVRILLYNILRHPNGQPFASQIHDAVARQNARMEKAAADEKARKYALLESSRKRLQPPSTPSEEPSDPKRLKLEHENDVTATTPFLATVDFTQLPVSLITDLVVANLQAFTEPALLALIQAYKQSQAASAPVTTVVGPSTEIKAPTPIAPPMKLPEIGHEPTPEVEVAPVKEEPVDPLKMDIDEVDLEYEPDRLNKELSGDGEMIVTVGSLADATVQEDLTLGDGETVGRAGGVGGGLQVIDLKLPPPKEFSEEDRDLMIRESVTRIWTCGSEFAEGASSADLWMLLMVRLVTRLVEPPLDEAAVEAEKEKLDGQEGKGVLVDVNFYGRQDRMRQTLCNYVMEDFHSRVRLATAWMNEEWYNDRIRSSLDPHWRPNYDIWLNQIVAAFQTHLDAKDRAFSKFLLDLPAVPTDIMSLLRDLCVDEERMSSGFNTLREFVASRPTLRREALRVLLELTTHEDKITRGAAINTIKRWVPDVQPMDNLIREFALKLLRRLQSPGPSSEKMDVDAVTPGVEEKMEDGQLPTEALAKTPYLSDALQLPADRGQVLQHLELMFALTVKVPEFLDEIFAAYGHMDVSVQEHVQGLISPLIRALGSSHGKLLTLLRNFPPGAESLALRIIVIFTDSGRPSAQLVTLVKTLVSERDLDARFLIPIIAEMDKADILRHLPRIVSMLNQTPEPNRVIRSVFSSIVTTPPQSFGTVTSNVPRVRQSELFTPAELMVVLHEKEKEIGLKSTIEAIGICFSMADIYRSEILAVVMQQIVDEPVLPTLFLRTVIQAVKMYKSLVGFVSTTLLSRLITKKIWMNGPLWEGFIVCAKVIAPASFGALLQLPKEQLKDLVEKQPGLKSGLRDYVVKKAGNKARTAGYLDIFGEDESQDPGPSGEANGQQQQQVQPAQALSLSSSAS